LRVIGDFNLNKRLSPRIPRYAQALLDALSLSGSDGSALQNLSTPEWKSLLSFADRSQLTLALGDRYRSDIPPEIRKRVERCLIQNANRWEQVKSAYQQCASAFETAGLPFLILKGFSHCPDFVSDPRIRSQYDLDLLFRREDILAAYDIAVELGYEPLTSSDKLPTDHLPTMIRKTGWEWKGDYFDTEIPISLEIHFRLWDENTERFEAPGLKQFWERRQARQLEGIRFTALHPADAAGYSALHILRHLLRGALRPSHVYELALFLNRRSNDDTFWATWAELHDPALQYLEFIAFELARRWFHCRLAESLSDSVTSLPANIRRWMELYSESPIAGQFYPNKDDVWLHWSLLDSLPARLSILRRRLMPQQVPGAIYAVHTASRDLTWRTRLCRKCLHIVFVLRRAAYHLLAVLPTMRSAARWWCGGAKIAASE
jgi:hypothetical protein